MCVFWWNIKIMRLMTATWWVVIVMATYTRKPLSYVILLEGMLARKRVKLKPKAWRICLCWITIGPQIHGIICCQNPPWFWLGLFAWKMIGALPPVIIQLSEENRHMKENTDTVRSAYIWTSDLAHSNSLLRPHTNSIRGSWHQNKHGKTRKTHEIHRKTEISAEMAKTAHLTHFSS
jgi:hypothetical protein